MPSPCALPGRPRAGGRLARGPALAAALAARLTARDRWLLRMLLRAPRPDHRADHPARVRHHPRRHRPDDRPVPAPGRRPVPAAGPRRVLPAALHPRRGRRRRLAAEDGITPAELGYRRDRAVAIALSPRLAHDTGANGVFAALAAAARASGGQAGPGVLVGRAALRRHLGRARPPRRVRPLDRAGPRPAARRRRLLPRVRHRHRGPAPAHRQARRLRRLAARTGITTPVLFCLPSPRREAALRARLAGPPPHGIPRRRPPRRSPASPSPPPPPTPAPAARPGPPGSPPAAPGPAAARPARPARHRPGPAAARTARHPAPARRPALAPARPRPARLERPARRAPPRPGRR